MSKIIRNAKKKISRMERGQVLVLVAGAAIGIIAAIGLTLDVGLMFIGNARLRRAVDAAALSSAVQFRSGYNIGTLTDAANEFLMFDGFPNPNSTITTCDFNPTPDMGCTSGQHRKLVRVHATTNIPLAFLPVIGINSVQISATAISETASLDVVLVIDRSESMTYSAAVGDPLRDPFYCNGNQTDSSGNQVGPASYTEHGYTHKSSCTPFKDVIAAAIQFTNILFFPYDAMSIVTFDKDAGVVDTATGKRVPNLSLQDSCPNAATCTPATTVIPALEALTVFQGGESTGNPTGALSIYNGVGSPAPSRCYGQTSACSSDICNGDHTDSTTYKGIIGTSQDPCLAGYVNPPDPSLNTTTNIGAGLEMAGNELATDTRQDVLWVVILLTDGVPNAGHTDDNLTYYCPSGTWTNLPAFPVCDNGNAAVDWLPYDSSHIATTRPYKGDSVHSIPPAANYDALSYAFDQADFVGLPYDPANPAHSGQDALLYTIGLGSELNNYKLSSFTYTGFNYPTGGTTVNNVGLGTVFLTYAADVGRGLYFPAPGTSQLTTIFRSIGGDIATRLAK